MFLNDYQCESVRDLDRLINKHGLKSPEVKAFVDDCVDYQVVAVMQLWMERKKMHLSHAYDRVFFTCVDTFIWVFIPGVAGYVIGGIIVALAYTILGGTCSLVGHAYGRT